MRTPSVLGSAQLVAFVATANPRRAKEFYQKKLGLRLVHEDNFAIVFDANGVTLRVTVVDQVRAAGYTVLGWVVPNVVEIAKQLEEAGIKLQRYPGMEQDDCGIWTSPSGARVGWFHDPDENTLSITQLD
jgi:catechol 2,3-dioxygenase-like lactoylglutathione lyase family enzyme